VKRYPILLILFTVIVHAAQPWDTPFAKDVRALLTAARAVSVPADSGGVIILLDEQRYTIDAAGRIHSTVRKVYRIVDEDAVDEWSSIQQQYAPWHEGKPEFRARVISADAVEHWLDAKTIGDSPSLEFEPNVFSDSRVLRAPFPLSVRV
jgi:hypothetical protein